ncbi:UNVERIFIED_CONTAM: hypothetical protein K2H54_027469 [Gekko kuhli]
MVQRPLRRLKHRAKVMAQRENACFGRGRSQVHSSLSIPKQKGPRSDFLAVLYDYPTPDIGQPIFQVGEKLRVIADEGGWWRARSLTTGHENYIPEDCVAKVYHGWLFEGLGREKAEELLQLPNTKTGSFMIRKSETTKGLYSLSVRHIQVKHYRIFRLPNNWYYISPRQTFQCLEDLVNHYSEEACTTSKLPS